MKAKLSVHRDSFHKRLLNGALSVDSNGIPSIADKGQKFSCEVASLLVGKLGDPLRGKKQAGQSAGNEFEAACLEFVKAGFLGLKHLRPGKWECAQIKGRGKVGFSKFEQYQHLSDLDSLAKKFADLASALGNDYTISPDLVIYRIPEADSDINCGEEIVDARVANQTPLRLRNNSSPILLASISCKWTLRSDRAQNARSEALNLIRNRKGRCPNIVVVTAEPTPSRLSSLALGTGDIDCVYHFALPELRDSIVENGNEEALSLLDIMVHGKRLKDIGDLPLDLVI